MSPFLFYDNSILHNIQIGFKIIDNKVFYMYLLLKRIIMKNLLLTLLLTFPLFLFSQTVIEYDNMETSSTNYLSAGWWTPAATAGWYNNASVSPTLSAAIYGVGNGTSAIEQDWYSMPTITLDPTKLYQLKFNVASYTFSSPTAATRGLDGADYLSVQVSSNGGTYVTEMRIVGNANATWAFTNTSSVTHTSNGSFTNSAAPTGDVYTVNAGASTLTPATYTLNLLPNLSSVAIDFYCRINSAGEEWWLDNIQLIRIDPLPVELIYFEGFTSNSYNLLKWSTASEHNSDYFSIEKSIDGEIWNSIGKINASGNSNQIINYSFIDYLINSGITYYKLKQVDYDGVFKEYGPISINNIKTNKNIIKYVNLMGQDIDENAKGIIIVIYDDGTTEKIFR